MSKKVNTELLRIITENPDLPIFAMVDSDIVGDDAFVKWWFGTIKSVEVKECLVTTDNDLHFKDDHNKTIYDKHDFLGNRLSREEFKALPGEKVDEEFEKLPWKKAIIVCIVSPEI